MKSFRKYISNKVLDKKSLDYNYIKVNHLLHKFI